MPTVLTSIEVSEDGDTCFSVTPEPTDGAALEYRTGAVLHRCTSIHCEVVPDDRERLADVIALLRPGVRVRVGGRRAWDGCHHGRGVVFDALMVLLGAGPVVDGWLEIHPVASIEVLL